MDAATLSMAQSDARRHYGTTQPLELNESYASFPDGEPVTALSGQPYKLRGSNYPPSIQANNRPLIESGFLTQRETAERGAYAEITLQKPINRFGCRWKFAPETVAGQTMCIALFTKSYVDYANATGNVPKSGPHVLVTRSTLQVTTFNADGAAPIDSGMGVITFTAGLAADDATIHSIEFYLDIVSGFLYTYAPDGQVYVCQNEQFKSPCPVGFIEPYRSIDYAPGQGRVKFSHFWMSSQGDAELAAAKIDAWSGPLWSKKVTPASDVSYALTTAHTRPAGTLTDFAFRVPPKKRVRIEAEFFIDITAAVAASEIRLGLQDGSNGLLTYEIVATKISHSGRCRAVFEHSLSENIGTSVLRKISFATVDAGTTATLQLKPLIGGSITVTAIR